MSYELVQDRLGTILSTHFQSELEEEVLEQSSVVFQGSMTERLRSVPLSLCSILIVDWDVHHGNATQHMFYNDKKYVHKFLLPVTILSNQIATASF